MTIEEVGERTIACVWFDKGKVCRDEFPPYVLKRNTDGVDMILKIEGWQDEGSR
jgi:hypothetical protein